MKTVMMMLVVVAMGAVGCMSPYTVQQEEEALIEGDGFLPDDGYIEEYDADTCNTTELDDLRHAGCPCTAISTAVCSSEGLYCVPDPTSVTGLSWINCN